MLHVTYDLFRRLIAFNVSPFRHSPHSPTPPAPVASSLDMKTSQPRRSRRIPYLSTTAAKKEHSATTHSWNQSSKRSLPQQPRGRVEKTRRRKTPLAQAQHKPSWLPQLVAKPSAPLLRFARHGGPDLTALRGVSSTLNVPEQLDPFSARRLLFSVIIANCFAVIV